MDRRRAALPLKGEDLSEEICRWLEQWFVGRGKLSTVPEESFREKNYFDAGLLSSLEIIEFVTEIENHFGVQFSDADFQDARLVTISGLAELIAEHSATDSAKLG